MPKASQLKKGNVARINGQLYLVRSIVVQSPSARGASTLYKIRFEAVQSKQKLDETFRGDDMVEEVVLDRAQVEYSYPEGDAFVFMDVNDFTQYTLTREELGDQGDWLVEGLDDITALLLDGRIVSIELPAAIESDIVETSPAMKGASATARTKPATLENGVVVQVPEYLGEGERIRVSTEDGHFIGRV
jgi:elongation factor P